MPHWSRLFLVLVGLSGLVSACLSDKAPAPAAAALCDTANVTYAKDIQPILGRNCNLSGCHNQADYEANSGVPLYDYQTARDGVEVGDVLCAIKGTDGCERMPKEGASLTACQIAAFEAWQRQGFKE